MAALGFDPEDFDESDLSIEVWECNAEAVYVFVGMDTQWRESFAGRTGLDYSALPVVMKMVRVDEGREVDVFSSVRTMEQEALMTIAENRDND